jgi:hypothetical protein
MGEPAPLWLDVLEEEAELLRQRIGVSTLSISHVDASYQVLSTVVNVGVLGEGHEVRPADERYSLALYPAAAELIRRRRPFVAGPDAPDASLDELGHRLGKETQAAAPIVIGDVVWGELWVASVPGDLPLARAELPLIEWAAEVFADEAADVLARARPTWGRTLRRWYEIWVTAGAWERQFRVRTELVRYWGGGFVMYEGGLSQGELLAALMEIHRLGGDIAGLRCEHERFRPPRRRAGFDGREYELRYAGEFPVEALEVFGVDVSLDGTEVVVRRVCGQPVLLDVVADARRMGGQLVSIVSS